MSEEELVQLQRQVSGACSPQGAERSRGKEFGALSLQPQLQRASDRRPTFAWFDSWRRVWMNVEGDCTFVNASCLRMLGYQNSMNCWQTHAHTHPSFPFRWHPYPLSECKPTEFIRPSQINVSDEVFWRKDGSPFPLNYRSNPILVDGAVVGA